MPFVVLLILPRPPTSTLFPYTTLFRSDVEIDPLADAGRPWMVQARAKLTRIVDATRHAVDAREVAGRVGAKRSGNFTRRSEEHTSELQSRFDLVCRLLLEKKKIANFST